MVIIIKRLLQYNLHFIKFYRKNLPPLSLAVSNVLPICPRLHKPLRVPDFSIKTKKIRNVGKKIKSGWKGRTWPEAYARCVREIAAAYIANLPTAVSNNWLPRQVHIPPIMCITAPYTAMQDGRDIVDDTLPLLLQIYLSPPCLPQRSFNEHVIDASSRYPFRFGPFHASEIDICDILLGLC